MKTTHLQQFLIDSNRAGYARGNDKEWIKETDGSTSIFYESGQWKSHDNFFGGEPYGGRLVVFYDQKPVWIMVYYGWIVGKDNPNEIYAVLRGALQQMPEDAPFRGPKKFSSHLYEYSNTWTGTLNRYSGEEYIYQNKTLLYSAYYRGGFVDQQEGI